MGITRIFGRFFIFLFCTFGAFLLFVNLYVYSKGESSYFGFTSLINMMNNIPTLPTFDETAKITIGELEISVYLPNLVERIYNDAIGTALNLFGFFGGDVNIFNFLQAIFNLLIAPIKVIFDLVIVIASILWDLVDLLPFIFNLLKGGFNVPLT